MSGRTTDTHERVIAVALELFSQKGYDQTSLRQIAERLGITKAALYYHFPSKEALLKAVVDRQLVVPVDQLLRWLDNHPEPRALDTRRELLARIAELLRGSLGPWIRFAQQNQLALQDHPDVAESTRLTLVSLLTHVVDKHLSVHDQLRSILALAAVYLGNLVIAPDILKTIGLNATPDQLATAAMDVAMELIDPPHGP